MKSGLPVPSTSLGATLGHSPRAMFLVAVGLLGAVTAGNVLTPFGLGFSAFYVIPVLIATWAAGMHWGLAFAFLSAFIWYGVDWASGHSFPSEVYRLWDAFNHLVAYSMVAAVAGKLRQAYLREQTLREDLEISLRNVHELEGLLPMCAWCKKIRNDEGYWQEVEAYLKPRTKASFTHGICPTCSEKMMKVIGDASE